MTKKIKLIGSNLTSLVIACELIDKNIDFQFYATSPILGSSWAGLRHGDYLLDLGQRYFELYFEQALEKDVQQFDVKLSHRDFAHHVRKFIEKYVKLKTVSVQTFFRDKIIKCPLETVDLKEFLELLSDDEKDLILLELSNNKYKEDLDFEHLNGNNIIDSSISLSKVLRNSHSETLNEVLILPFIRKFNIDLDNVSFNLRRKLWCPLFYRSTLINELNGNRIFYPERPHFGICNNSTSEFVQILIKKVQNSSSWADQHIVEQYIQNELHSDLKSTNDLILSTSLDWLARFLRIPYEKEKFNFRAIWISLPEEDLVYTIEYLSIIPQNIPFFRISGSTHSNKSGEVVLCIESADSVASVKDIVGYLHLMGLVKQTSKPNIIKDVNVKLEAPTFKNMHTTEDLGKKILSVYPSQDLTLCGSIFGKNTFNDQILLGLKKSKELINEKNK